MVYFFASQSDADSEYRFSVYRIALIENCSFFYAHLIALKGQFSRITLRKVKNF